MKNLIGILGHKIADFDTQSGVSGAIMRLCWRIGYTEKSTKNKRSK
jgi:hypothetical protein